MSPRKKVANSTRGRKSLRLKGNGPLLDLPLDILLEILKIVHPLDLLYLSRTNKALREFLLDRTSVSIWRGSLELVEGSPPQCPPYTNEVQWTRLLFEEVCHVCCSTLEHDFSFDPIWWEFGARYCSECCPDQVVKKLPKKLTQDFTVNVWKEVFPRCDGWYLATGVNEFMEKYSAANATKSRTTLIQERRNQTKVITDHAQICRPWMKRIVTARGAALQEVKNARWTAIKAKFREAGWRDGLIMRCISGWKWNHDLVNIPKLLSDAEWNRIGHKLNKEVEDAVRGSVMSDRFRTLSLALPNLASLTEHLAFSPRMIDVALLPDVRAILEGDLKLEITADDLKAALQPKLPGLLEAWSSAFETQLRDHTRTVLNLPSDNTMDPFEYALAYFVCDNKCCQGHFTGKRKPCRAVCYRWDADDTYEDQAIKAFSRKPCTVDDMFSLTPALTVLEDVVKHYKKDPQNTTCKEMDAAPGKLWCMRCVMKNQPTGWRDAVRCCFLHYV
ncbi:hypothetical protein B0H13DRAFT_2105152 [Mycena leptocephala]|nr:hypothetical protein B0H13DRAFT_2105152 [Mycena leptocephala]